MFRGDPMSMGAASISCRCLKIQIMPRETHMMISFQVFLARREDTNQLCMQISPVEHIFTYHEGNFRQFTFLNLEIFYQTRRSLNLRWETVSPSPCFPPPRGARLPSPKSPNAVPLEGLTENNLLRGVRNIADSTVFR